MRISRRVGASALLAFTIGVTGSLAASASSESWVGASSGGPGGIAVEFSSAPVMGDEYKLGMRLDGSSMSWASGYGKLVSPDTTVTWQDSTSDFRPTTGLPTGLYTVDFNRSSLPATIYPAGWISDEGWLPVNTTANPTFAVGTGLTRLEPVVPIGGVFRTTIVDTAGAPVTKASVSLGADGGQYGSMDGWERAGGADDKGVVSVTGLIAGDHAVRVAVGTRSYQLTLPDSGNVLVANVPDGLVSTRTAVLGQTTELGTFVAPDVFSDVRASHPFAGEIYWMKNEGISTGYADGSYGPSSHVTRGAMAAFLYRSAGEPAFDLPVTSPFADVAPGDAFYKEISWLASSGISTGTVEGGSTYFRPASTVSRQAMSAFLFRAASTSSASSFVAPVVSPFPDVSTTQPFYREMAWMSAAGISTGYGDGSFQPASPVSRMAMSAFLQRAQFFI